MKWPYVRAFLAALEFKHLKHQLSIEITQMNSQHRLKDARKDGPQSERYGSTRVRA